MSAYIGWIIALVVLGMMAFPILQIVPSKRQKQLIQLRQAAIQQGLQVHINTPQLPDGLDDQYQALKFCAAYLLPFTSDEQSRFKQSCLALRSTSTADEWFWINNQRPPAELLQPLLDVYAKLPDYCLAVQQSPAGSAIYWKENGDETRVEQIHQQLQALNKVIVKAKPSLFNPS